MAKVTNFLSIALLVSLFAVVPAFGMNAGTDAAAPVDAQPKLCTRVCTKVAEITNSTLNVVDYANPFSYGVKLQETHATKARVLKYAAVIALVATNPTVQGALNSFVSTVQNALGLAEDEADEAVEPTRLVIGRKA